MSNYIQDKDFYLYLQTTATTITTTTTITATIAQSTEIYAVDVCAIDVSTERIIIAYLFTAYRKRDDSCDLL